MENQPTTQERPLIRNRRSTLRWYATSSQGKLATLAIAVLVAVGVVIAAWTPLTGWTAQAAQGLAHAVVGTPPPTPQASVDVDALLAAHRALGDEITAAKQASANAAAYPELAAAVAELNTAISHAEEVMQAPSPSRSRMEFETALLRTAIGDLPAKTQAAADAKAAADAAAKAAQDAANQQPSAPAPQPTPAPARPAQPSQPKTGSGGGTTQVPQTATTSVTAHCTTSTSITFTATGNGTVTISSGGRSASGSGSASITVSGPAGNYSASASASGTVNIRFSSSGSCS